YSITILHHGTLHVLIQALQLSFPLVHPKYFSDRGGLTIWKLGHCLRARGQ
ncbi:unnamed protein product, partial [Staurois parvus]